MHEALGWRGMKRTAVGGELAVGLATDATHRIPSHRIALPHSPAPVSALKITCPTLSWSSSCSGCSASSGIAAFFQGTCMHASRMRSRLGSDQCLFIDWHCPSHSRYQKAAKVAAVAAVKIPKKAAPQETPAAPPIPPYPNTPARSTPPLIASPSNVLRSSSCLLACKNIFLAFFYWCIYLFFFFFSFSCQLADAPGQFPR